MILLRVKYKVIYIVIFRMMHNPPYRSGDN